MADLTDMVPVVVTANLSAGFAVGAGWGIALDGLLASQVWARHKTQLRAGGVEVPRLVEQEQPIDLPLPLTRCGHGPDWHWAATCAWPVQDDAGDEPVRDVRTWTGRIDERICRQLSGVEGLIPVHHGRWRHRLMPVVVTLCTAVRWRAVGNPVRLAQLLTPVAAIGKKRSQGEGHVLRWEVRADPDADQWEFGHLHPGGALGRPAPAECFTDRAVPHAGVGMAGIRPPYNHLARQRSLLRPMPLP